MTITLRGGTVLVFTLCSDLARLPREVDLQSTVVLQPFSSAQAARLVTMSTLAYISTPPPTPHQIAIAHLASGLYPPRNAKPIDVDNWFNKNAKYHHALLRLITREGLLVS